jgi:hypothetical protein
MRYRNHEDDDAHIVRDGERVRVPLTMMDGLSPMQRAIARDSMLVDGDGQGGIALNRPGFRMLASDARRSRTVKRDPRGRIISTAETEEEEDARDGAMHDARQRAYDAYEDQLTNAWRGDAAAERAPCPNCSGTGRDEDGEECEACGGEGYESSAEEIVRNASTHTESAGRDSRSVSQQMVDHKTRMSQIYDQIDRELAEAWRSK